MKIILFICSFLIFFSTCDASEKQKVIFSKCVDGDTAEIILNKEKIKIRFLAIDTPEVKHPTKKQEPYSKEASVYTCNTLTNANKIEIEYDNNSDKFDKYNRHLVWIFVDDELLQEQIIEKGLGKIAYLYDNYKYTDLLEKKQLIAQKAKVGVWSNVNNDYTNIIISIILLLALTIIFLINKKYRTKIINNFKRKTKNKIIKILKN